MSETTNSKKAPPPITIRNMPTRMLKESSGSMMVFYQSLFRLNRGKEGPLKRIKYRAAWHGHGQFFADGFQEGFLMVSQSFEIGDQCGTLDPLKDRIRVLQCMGIYLLKNIDL